MLRELLCYSKHNRVIDNHTRIQIERTKNMDHFEVVHV
jgi:hypothetical protein